MKPRELAGEINRAEHCHVYVEFSGHEEGAIWLEVSRRQAKEIVKSAYDDKIEEIAAHVEDGEVFIGDPVDMPDVEDEEPPPVSGRQPSVDQ
jgi:precorrin-2 methylase